MKWYTPNKWQYRKNKKRKSSNNEGHPSLVVGKEGTKFANVGITHSPKRGHHSNIELSRNPNPRDKKKAYLRDDVGLDDERFLKEILKGYQLADEDIPKVLKVIEKYKKRIGTRR